MTPDERAEKIADAIGINPNWGREKSVQYYAAEIRHAEYAAGEAAAMILKITRDAEIRAAVEEAETKERMMHGFMVTAFDQRDKAKADAYEEAAKMCYAERNNWSGAAMAACEKLASIIRAHAKELQ